MSRLIGRLRARLAPDDDRADRTLALLIGAPSLVQAVVAPIAVLPLSIAIAVFSTAPIAWRRSRPALAVVAGTLPWLVPTDAYLALGYVAAFILYYSLARHVAERRAFVPAAAGGLALALAGTAINDGTFADFAAAATVLLTALGVGRFVAHERRQTRRLEELALHLERERERAAGLAVAEERARIARELHDAVSHALSVIAIQADAAEAVLDRDPGRAREPIGAIRQSAAEALAEMRRLLGVLREDDDGASLAPLPGVGQIPALVTRVRAAGMRVELHVSGEPVSVPASLGVSAYRIVQEALTNVRKHAPRARARVEVHWRDGSLDLAIRDYGQGAGLPVESGGHGLVGMRERVRLHGGELHAGPCTGGGFEVAASLPLAVAAEPAEATA
jgi:signal transduction histidine kinase